MSLGTYQSYRGPVPAHSGFAGYNLISHIGRKLSTLPPQQRPDCVQEPRSCTAIRADKPAEGLIALLRRALGQGGNVQAECVEMMQIMFIYIIYVESRKTEDLGHC